MIIIISDNGTKIINFKRSNRLKSQNVKCELQGLIHRDTTFHIIILYLEILECILFSHFGGLVAYVKPSIHMVPVCPSTADGLRLMINILSAVEVRVSEHFC